MAHFNDQVITEFRANQGHVGHGFGSSLLLIHTVGRKSGEARVNPALSLRDGEDWLVVGSAAGAEADPAWVLNLRATPETTIEVPAVQTGSQHIELVAVLADELEGDERERAFTRFQEKSAAFSEYQRKAGQRTLPIIRLRRR